MKLQLVSFQTKKLLEQLLRAFHYYLFMNYKTVMKGGGRSVYSLKREWKLWYGLVLLQGKGLGLTVCKLTDRDLMRSLEGSIRLGKPLLIENVATELDPALDPVLTRQTFVQGSQIVIKLGDIIVPFSPDFRLYLTTRLANPHYTPEVAVKVLLVNFTLVPRSVSANRIVYRIVFHLNGSYILFILNWRGNVTLNVKCLICTPLSQYNYQRSVFLTLSWKSEDSLINV